MIAADLLVCDIKNHDDQSILLHQFLTMELCWQVLEIVGTVCSVFMDRKVILQKCIYSCMDRCSKESNSNSKMKYVRLVIEMISLVLSENASALRELFYEIQSFCLQFSSMKEAIEVYSLIKTFEGH